MTAEVDHLPPARNRWAHVAKVLGRQFSLAHDGLRRIQEETPEDTHIRHEAFAIRNVQILSTEALDFLRFHWEASAQESRGETPRSPDYRVSRWREVLDVTHPARPYNPHLGTPPDLRRQIQETRDALKARGILCSSAPITAEDPTVRHFALLAKKADTVATERICSHESIGVLRALADLTNLAAETDTNPILRVHAGALNNHVKRLEEVYRQSLTPHLNIPAGENAGIFTAAAATDFQNIGLLRSRLRRDHNAFNLTPEQEMAFLRDVSNEWNTYHLAIKPVVFFEALLRLKKEEIDSLRTTVAETKIALGRAAPLYSQETVAVTVDTAVEPLLRTIDTARDYAPFLDRHRETLIKAGRATAIAGLAYGFSLAPAGLAALGETSIYQQHVGPTLKHILDSVSANKSKVLVTDAVKELTKGIPKAVAENIAGSRLDSFAGRFREFLFSRMLRRPAKQGARTEKIQSTQRESLKSVFIKAADRLSETAWSELCREHRDFLAKHGPAVKELLAFGTRAESTLRVMRASNRAFQELSKPGTTIGVGYSPAYRSDCEGALLRARRELETVQRLAESEAKLRKATGPAAELPGRTYWHNRYSLLAQMAEMSFADAKAGKHSLLQERPLAMIQVRHDPSPCDQTMWEMINLEDRHARSAGAGPNDSIPANLNPFHFGIRYHTDLPPTYHFSQTLVKSLFRAVSDRDVAGQFIAMLREPGVVRTMLRDVDRIMQPAGNAPITSVGQSVPAIER